MNNNNKIIIGFDLGHGNFSLIGCDYQKTKQALQEAQIHHKKSDFTYLEVNGQKSQITALARYRNEEGVVNRIIVGEEAATSKGEAQEFEIGFKQIPENVELERNIKDFVNSIYKHLTDITTQNQAQLPKSNQRNYFFIGCPSGWFTGNYKLYEKIFKDTQLKPNVKVVSESHAAFMHARAKKETFSSNSTKNAEEKDAITRNDLKKPVLVIDCGSLTTDYTRVCLDDKGNPDPKKSKTSE